MGLNNAIQYPCKGCTNRSKVGEPNCHDYCEAYLACKKKSAELNERIRSHKTFVSVADFYQRMVIVNE